MFNRAILKKLNEVSHHGSTLTFQKGESKKEQNSVAEEKKEQNSSSSEKKVAEKITETKYKDGKLVEKVETIRYV